MEQTKTLRVQAIPALAVIVELPELDEEGNEIEDGEIVKLKFEVRRHTTKHLPKILKDSKALTEKYHDGDFNEIEYAEKMEPQKN